MIDPRTLVQRCWVISNSRVEPALDELEEALLELVRSQNPAFDLMGDFPFGHLQELLHGHVTDESLKRYVVLSRRKQEEDAIAFMEPLTAAAISARLVSRLLGPPLSLGLAPPQDSYRQFVLPVHMDPVWVLVLGDLVNKDLGVIVPRGHGRSADLLIQTVHERLSGLDRDKSTAWTLMAYEYDSGTMTDSMATCVVMSILARTSDNGIPLDKLLSRINFSNAEAAAQFMTLELLFRIPLTAQRWASAFLLPSGQSAQAITARHPSQPRAAKSEVEVAAASPTEVDQVASLSESGAHMQADRDPPVVNTLEPEPSPGRATVQLYSADLDSAEVAVRTPDRSSSPAPLGEMDEDLEDEVSHGRPESPAHEMEVVRRARTPDYKTDDIDFDLHDAGLDLAQLDDLPPSEDFTLRSPRTLSSSAILPTMSLAVSPAISPCSSRNGKASDPGPPESLDRTCYYQLEGRARCRECIDAGVACFWRIGITGPSACKRCHRRTHKCSLTQPAVQDVRADLALNALDQLLLAVQSLEANSGYQGSDDGDSNNGTAVSPVLQRSRQARLKYTEFLRLNISYLVTADNIGEPPSASAADPRYTEAYTMSLPLKDRCEQCQELHRECDIEMPPLTGGHRQRKRACRACMGKGQCSLVETTVIGASLAEAAISAAESAVQLLSTARDKSSAAGDAGETSLSSQGLRRTLTSAIASIRAMGLLERAGETLDERVMRHISEGLAQRVRATATPKMLPSKKRAKPYNPPRKPRGQGGKRPKKAKSAERDLHSAQEADEENRDRSQRLLLDAREEE